MRYCGPFRDVYEIEDIERFPCKIRNIEIEGENLYYNQLKKVDGVIITFNI